MASCQPLDGRYSRRIRIADPYLPKDPGLSVTASGNEEISSPSFAENDLAKLLSMKENFSYPNVYDVDQVAQILQVKPGVVYREIRAGRLAARKVGKQYRVHEHALDRYLLEPWENQAENPSQCASGPVQATADGSSSIMESRFLPASALEAANMVLRNS